MYLKSVIVNLLFCLLYKTVESLSSPSLAVYSQCQDFTRNFPVIPVVKRIYHGLCNLFFGVLRGMLFCCFISGRLYI